MRVYEEKCGLRHEFIWLLFDSLSVLTFTVF